MEVSVPIGWILGTIGVLGSTIAALAGVMWGFMKSRLEAQDKIIDAQNVTIKGLQDDVERMSKGCGAGGCVWGKR